MTLTPANYTTTTNASLSNNTNYNKPKYHYIYFSKLVKEREGSKNTICKVYYIFVTPFFRVQYKNSNFYYTAMAVIKECYEYKIEMLGKEQH